MRCGRCKEQPTTIAHVQRCYGIIPKQEQYEATPAPPDPDDITPKQRRYILDLLVKKGVDENELSDKFGYVVTDCYKDEAREVISYLLTLPDKQQATKDPDVPAGRYALLQPGFHGAVDNTWKFYQVDKPTTGRWAGRTFLSALASDEKYPIKDPQRRAAVLAAIALDPAKASRDYGRQVGRCGVCGRLLTDPDSIAYGQGPICREKYFG